MRALVIVHCYGVVLGLFNCSHHTETQKSSQLFMASHEEHRETVSGVCSYLIHLCLCLLQFAVIPRHPCRTRSICTRSGPMTQKEKTILHVTCYRKKRHNCQVSWKNQRNQKKNLLERAVFDFKVNKA